MDFGETATSTIAVAPGSVVSPTSTADSATMFEEVERHTRARAKSAPAGVQDSSTRVGVAPLVASVTAAGALPTNKSSR